MFRIIFTALILLTGLPVYAQQFGGNPPSIKWQQVNNPVARIIYPKGLDSVAIMIAGIVQQLSTTTQSSIGNRQYKINIVLQNQTTASNGYVGLGPYRSEFYLTPPQNSFTLGSLPWPVFLSIHEFRHVQQNNNFNVGLSKVLRVLFGEQAQALANSVFVPDWFYEGDAVYNETNLSKQGRGRLPFFFNGYRSLWAAGRSYNWMKLRNGSLKDYIPDHYQLGYLLTAYGREKYGDEFWKNVTQDAAAGKGLFYPFQKAVKRYSGKPYSSFRNDALNYFKSNPSLSKSPEQNSRSSNRHFIADEEFPAFINDSSVVYVKSSYKKIPAFFVRTNQKEKKIRVRDVSLEKQFSYRNGNIVYSSYRPDLRWGWKDYTDIKLLNLNTGKQRSVTKTARYFSPDISEDGSVIVAVQVSPDGKPALHFLDAANGSVITSVPNPENLFYTYPKLYNDKKVITAVRNTSGQMSMALIDGSNGNTDYLVPFSFNVIGFPFIRNDTVYFTTSHLGNDRLFAFTIRDRKLYRLPYSDTENLSGDYQPVVSAKTILWSRFTDTGFQLQQVPLAKLRWITVTNAEFSSPPSGFSISSIDKNPAGSFLAQQMQATGYRKSFRLFNFHSLQPLANDPVYSLSLIGENVLNTLQSELFLRYNRNEQYKQFGFNAVYGAWFPYVSAGINYTIDRRALYRGRRVYWNEMEYRGGVSVPFNFSKGRHYTGLTVGADYVYNQSYFKGNYKDSFDDRSFSYINSTVSLYNQVQKARQQIYPRFAQSLLLNYKKSISSFEAGQFLASGYLYLPGFSLTHNLVLNGAFQQRDTLNQRSFSNNFPFSRGYTSANLYRMVKGGANYHFPLWYPDIGFAGIVYLLRMRSNLFYDHTYVTDSRLRTAAFRSGGTEIFFDTKWWNQLPLTVGLRYSYLLDRDIFGGRGVSRFEVILPVNLIQR